MLGIDISKIQKAVNEYSNYQQTMNSIAEDTIKVISENVMKDQNLGKVCQPTPTQDYQEYQLPSNVVGSIESERIYQKRKWRGDHPQDVATYLTILEKLLADAKKALIDPNIHCNHHAVMHEIRQITAVGVAAMEQHGAPTRSI